MEKVKIEKVVILSRVYEDGSSTEYEISKGDKDINIKHGNDLIYFPKHMLNVFIEALSEVGGE